MKIINRIFSKYIIVAIIVSLFSIVVGCKSTTDLTFIITKEKMPINGEYLGDVIVNKKGFYFLWFIPFASSSEEAAKELMRKKVLKEFPKADGVCEYKIIKKEGIGLFDWTPSIVIKGKIYKKR